MVKTFLSVVFAIVFLVGGTMAQEPNGSISLENVVGSPYPGEILAGDTVIFQFRLTNNLNETIQGMTNGFFVYSSDGAQWGQTVGTAVGADWNSFFDLIFTINHMSPDGKIIDSISVGGAAFPGHGMPAGFDQVGLEIMVGPIAREQAGKSICIDSAFIPPSTIWRWEGDSGGPFAPAWDGPHCFEIVSDIIIDPPPDTASASITLEDVIGSAAPGIINAGEEVSFLFRVTNYSGNSFQEMLNSFVVYSNDGATWNQTVGEAIGVDWSAMFDLVHVVNYFSADGQYADSLFIGGASFPSNGLPNGFDSVGYKITIGPIDTTHVGKTICIDSTFTPPMGYWRWSSQAIGTVIPSWDGPHCFEIGPPVEQVTDSLINLVQWHSGMHGNDHWYGIIPIVQPWVNHKQAAEALWYNGTPGYLATVTSPEENQFIIDSLMVANQDQPSIVDQFYLGGVSQDSIWQWLTGEMFRYTNWAPGEPNHDFETAIGMWGASNGAITGMWNDVPDDTTGRGDIHQLWALVEFGTNFNDTIIYPGHDSLVMAHPYRNYGDNEGLKIQPVMSKLSQPIHGATIPLKIPDGITVVELSRRGLVTENWDYTYSHIKEDSGFIFVALANSNGDMIPPDTTTLFNIIYKETNSSCEDSILVFWDTTLMLDVSRQLTFSSANHEPIYPGFNVYDNYTTIMPYIPADVDNTLQVDIRDLLYLIDAMYLAGPDAVVPNTSDVNGDCVGPDIADLTYLVAYMFQQGQYPYCGCLDRNSGKVLASSSAFKIEREYNNGFTTFSLNTEIGISGVEFVLEGQNGNKLEIEIDSDYDLFIGQKNNLNNGAIFDMTGEHYWNNGRHQLMRVKGEVNMVSATVADSDFNSYSLKDGNDIILPDAYGLSQNYPNPFNPTTNINFSLPAGDHVNLAVYNINGQKVSQLTNGYYEAGEHTIEFNGAQFSSGIYFYKIISGNYTETRKMVMLK